MKDGDKAKAKAAKAKTSGKEISSKSSAKKGGKAVQASSKKEGSASSKTGSEKKGSSAKSGSAKAGGKECHHQPASKCEIPQVHRGGPVAEKYGSVKAASAHKTSPAIIARRYVDRNR